MSETNSPRFAADSRSLLIGARERPVLRKDFIKGEGAFHRHSLGGDHAGSSNAQQSSPPWHFWPPSAPLALRRCEMVRLGQDVIRDLRG